MSKRCPRRHGNVTGRSATPIASPCAYCASAPLGEPLTLNSEAATSSPTVHSPAYPAFSMASITSSIPERASHGGAKPPSSPISVASPPNLAFRILARLWYTSEPMRMASAKDLAPVGITKYSWKGSLFPACEPPLITLKQGTGIISFVLPARSA